MSKNEVVVVLAVGVSVVVLSVGVVHHPLPSRNESDHRLVVVSKMRLMLSLRRC